MGRRPKAENIYKKVEVEEKKRGRRGRIPRIKVSEPSDSAKGKVVIGITMGDPTGIGPEVIIKALLDR